MSSINVTGVGIVTIILTVVISLVLKILKNSKKLSKCPPGKTGWPIIGESLTYLSNPKKFVVERMSKYSSEVFTTSIAGQKTAIFCGPMANKFIFSNEGSLFRLWLPASALLVLGIPRLDDESKRGSSSNQFLYKFLQVKSIQEYVPIMDGVMRDHLHTHWDSKGTVKVHSIAKEFMLAACLQIVLNFRASTNSDDFRRLCDPFLRSLEGFLAVPINFPGTAYHKALTGSRLFKERITELVIQRKMKMSSQTEDENNDCQDLLSKLIIDDKMNGQIMSNEDIAGKIMSFLFAAFHPTTTTITFAIAHLADHPHIYDIVLREQEEIAKSKEPGEALTWMDIQKMKYSWNVICETMRLNATMPGNFRTIVSDFTYAGFNFLKGSKVLWSPYSTHTDPKYFVNPDKFDPSRFENNTPAPFTFVPFGGGARLCPGRDFVRILILSFLHRVVIKFKFKRVNPNEKIIYKIVAAPAEGLPIYLQPHVK